MGTPASRPEGSKVSNCEAQGETQPGAMCNGDIEYQGGDT